MQPIDLFTVSLEDYARLQIGFTIRTTRKLDIGRLKKALDKTLLSVPQLSCRFDPRKLRFIEAGYGAEDFVVPHREPANKAHEPRLDAEQQLMAVHIYDDGEGHLLKFCIDHILGDGRGLMEYFYLLCRYYNDPSADVAVNHRDIYRLSSHFAGIRKTKETRSPLRTLSDLGSIPRPGGFLPYAEGGDPVPNLCTIELTEAQVKKIKQKGKTLEATLNDVFLAACFAAVFALTDKESSRMDVPVDMRSFFRPYLEGKMTVTNFSSVYVVYADRADADSLDSLIRSVSKTMTERKNSSAFFGIIGLLYLCSRFIPLRRMKKLIARNAGLLPESYSNVGIIDHERLVFEGNEVNRAYFSSAFFPVPYFQVIFGTFKGTTTLTVSRNCSPENRRITEQILQTVRQILLDWTGK